MDISGFDRYNVTRIQVLDEYNEHSKCLVEISLENERVNNFISENGVGTKTICASADGDIVFSGTIRSIQCTRTYLNTHIMITAVSYTDYLDSEIHNRVFQNPDKTFSDINNFFKQSNVDINCADESSSREKIDDILVQYNETDFDFIKRIYNKKGCRLFVHNSKKSAACIKIGIGQKIEKVLIDEKDIITFEQTVLQDNEYVKISTDKIFDVGSQVEVSGGTYWIIKRDIEARYEKTQAAYTLVKDINNHDDTTKAQAVSLGLAKVTADSSEDCLGKIQVEFLDFENVMSDKKIWIDYLSPLTEKGGGIIAIPDEGEIVEVFIRQGGCIAIGCVRQNEFDEQVKNVSKRSMLIKNCLFTVDEKALEVTVDKNAISITDEIMTVSNDKFEIIIKDNQCKIGFDDSRVVFEENGIQGVSKNKVEIKTKQLEIESSSSVKIKTNSFDVG